MSRVLKKSTNLTGLAVEINPHHTLGFIYKKLLLTLQKLPESAAYRKYTEEIVEERVKILKTTLDVSEVEAKIGCGQIEEVIEQAKDELALARKMVVYKPWEPLVQKAPPTQWIWPPAK